MTPPAYERLAEVGVPRLIIVGAEDHFQLHKSTDKLTLEIADARRIEISDTHHIPNMGRPATFNQAMLDFLSTMP